MGAAAAPWNNRCMDLRHLRTFKLVAELGSLSKASDRLRVAQPALSRQIKQLEHELQTELFTRNGRGMMLTGAGRMLLERTAGLVRQIEQVRDDMRSAGGSPAGCVALGLVPTVSNVVSARFARRVAMELPQVSLRIVESYGGHLVEWLHRGELDLAIIYGPAVDHHLAVQPIGHDDVVAVGPPGSGLRDRGEVKLDWLLQQKLILPSYSHGLRADRKGSRPARPLAEHRDGSGLLPRADQPGGGRPRLHRPAPLRHPPGNPRRAPGNRRHRQAGDHPGELILAAPPGHPPSIASAAISAVLLAEIERLSAEGLWTIRLANDQATA